MPVVTRSNQLISNEVTAVNSNNSSASLLVATHSNQPIRRRAIQLVNRQGIIQSIVDERTQVSTSQRMITRSIQHLPSNTIEQKELVTFRNELNIAVIKGLSSIRARIAYNAQFSISHEMFSFLRAKYDLKFSLKPNEDFQNDLRVIHANFSSKRSYARVDSVKFAIRKRRDVMYKSFKNGKLEKNYLTPLPCFCLSFFRDDQVFNI
jgi:hypothetical protein